MSKRFIVTGGAGFIGTNLVRALNARGYGDIIVVDWVDCDEKKKNLAALQFSQYLDRSDFREAFLARRVQPVKAVFHLGACSSTTETDEDFLRDNNFLYTRQLCEWCLEQGIDFIYASSGATYGDGRLGYSDDDALTPALNPLNLYGKSKQMFDTWALENGHFDRIVGLKYFNVYGPYEDHKGDMRSVVNKAYYQVRETGYIRLFKSYCPDYADGEQVRDFVYVDDAVAVTLFFYDNPRVRGLFNCGTGTARTWNDLARAVFAAMDRPIDIRMIDMPAALRERYQYHTRADTTKLRAAGYQAPFTSLEDGIGDYVRNYLARRPA
jgi:ADP-L-glycero-D-manno-heptose 6-epimerase